MRRARSWAFGVDFGGTNTKIGLVHISGRVAASEVIRSAEVSDPKIFPAVITARLKALLLASGRRLSELEGIGIGVPGPVDPQSGIVRLLVNVPGWEEIPLRRAMERRIDLRCVVENDADAVALGEWRHGAGLGVSDMVCLTLGTGVGGGIIASGQLCRGVGGMAGELGHMQVKKGGRRCGCGRNGCLEAEAATAAIVMRARSAIRRGAKKLERAAREHGKLTPWVVYTAAASGDPFARAIWKEVGHWLGRGMAELITLLNPERIVIGGGLSGAWRFFAPELTRTVAETAFAPAARQARIVRARLGNRAGVVGATVLVWD